MEKKSKAWQRLRDLIPFLTEKEISDYTYCDTYPLDLFCPSSCQANLGISEASNCAGCPSYRSSSCLIHYIDDAKQQNIDVYSFINHTVEYLSGTFFQVLQSRSPLPQKDYFKVLLYNGGVTALMTFSYINASNKENSVKDDKWFAPFLQEPNSSPDPDVAVGAPYKEKEKEEKENSGIDEDLSTLERDGNYPRTVDDHKKSDEERQNLKRRIDTYLSFLGKLCKIHTNNIEQNTIKGDICWNAMNSFATELICHCNAMSLFFKSIEDVQPSKRSDPIAQEKIATAMAQIVKYTELPIVFFAECLNFSEDFDVFAFRHIYNLYTKLLIKSIYLFCNKDIETCKEKLRHLICTGVKTDEHSHSEFNNSLADLMGRHKLPFLNPPIMFSRSKIRSSYFPDQIIDMTIHRVFSRHDYFTHCEESEMSDFGHFCLFTGNVSTVSSSLLFSEKVILKKE